MVKNSGGEAGEALRNTRDDGKYTDLLNMDSL